VPSTRVGQIVDDERVTSDRLRFTLSSDENGRSGVWKGQYSGVHNLSHSFRVQIHPVAAVLPDGPLQPPPRAIEQQYGGGSATIPSSDPEILAFILRLDLRGPEHAVARARTLLTFTADELELVEGGSDDPLLCLAARECGVLGKERLLATLLRASGTPARVVQGLRLRGSSTPETAVWVEAWLDGWVSLSASQGFFGRRPSDLVTLAVNDAPLVTGVGMAAITHRYRALPERIGRSELAAVMVPSSGFFAPFSLYRLPVATQGSMMILLTVPLGCLLLALLRNVVGITTFGTFLPVLVALALRSSDLLTGFAMLASVVAIAFGVRILVARLHLLLVPRLCLMLCLVVLVVTGLSLTGRELEVNVLYSGVLFPIVILTMLVERLSISLDEEGTRNSMVRLGWTIAVTMAVYPLFQSESASHLMFGYPELVFVIMGVLVWIGGYTGYRLSEIIRFRSLSSTEATSG
jgi:hypothetical protein